MEELLWSLPSRERGLKYAEYVDSMVKELVAPFTGAWIEINNKDCFIKKPNVAPFTGAWIEINDNA